MNAQRTASSNVPMGFTLDTNVYFPFWKKDGPTTDTPVARISCVYTAEGRYRNQAQPPVPFNRRFVTTTGVLNGVEYDRALRHEDGHPLVRRFIIDVSSIHFWGTHGNASTYGGVANTLDNNMQGMLTLPVSVTMEC